jgi:pimeloyl-ACP methyl ester carboxylesterase
MRSARLPTAASLLAATLVAALPAAAQVQTEVPPPVSGARPVTVERIKVHGKTLEDNLEGNSVERDVLVFLPTDYATAKSRRYPVVYALHGYSIGAEQWSKEIHVPQTMEGAFALGAKDMIVVLPDSKTAHNGSMYSSSVTTGDFERFIAQDLVAYIDAHYRTIPERASRGLVGHSMGGYGATRIGMKHAAVFGSLYVMSPCCLSARSAGPANADLEGRPGDEDPDGFGDTLILSPRPACDGVGVVAKSEEPTPLLRPSDQGGRAATRGAGALGSQRAAGIRGPVHQGPSPVPGYCPGCR